MSDERPNKRAKTDNDSYKVQDCKQFKEPPGRNELYCRSGCYFHIRYHRYMGEECHAHYGVVELHRLSDPELFDEYFHGNRFQFWATLSWDLDTLDSDFAQALTHNKYLCRYHPNGRLDLYDENLQSLQINIQPPNLPQEQAFYIRIATWKQLHLCLEHALPHEITDVVASF